MVIAQRSKLAVLDDAAEPAPVSNATNPTATTACRIERVSGGGRLVAGQQLFEHARLEVARGAGAERDEVPGGQHVVQDQQLHERERVGAMELGADRELAELLLTK